MRLLIFCSARESDEPFDTTGDGFDNDKGQPKKPVLDIITTVVAARNGRRNVIRRRTSFTSDSDSGTSISEPYDRGLDNPKEVENTKMIIYSKHLINALNAVIGSYPGTNFLGDFVTISAPYKPFIHHRDALARYRMAQPAYHDDEYAATTASHIDVLLGYLDKTYGDQIREEEARHRRNPPVATFEWLWLLFKPGEVVYTQVQDVWTAFVIDQVQPWPQYPHHLEKHNSYNLTCWDIRYSQGRLRRCENKFNVPIFPGEQAIRTLEVVPAAFFSEDLVKQGGLSMAEKQIQMGKLYWELVQRPAYKEYDGQLVDKDGMRVGHVRALSVSNYSYGGPLTLKQLTGRVVVDAEGYDRFAMQTPNMAPRLRPPPPPFQRPGMMPPPLPPQGSGPLMCPLPQFSPRCSCNACLRNNFDRDLPGPLANFEDLNPLEDQPPKNDLFFLVCSPNIPAFILADRRWGHVSLDHLSEVRCDAESFKYLVLDPGVKLTVKALIGKFASSDGKLSPWPNDFVRNKGEGRIFLLHGSPGVGKTCTAECVAELTRRPLLAITSGDLAAPAVERQLSYFLALGERYGALVLIDECDVYLEARQARDLARNALVSVFLRALEYYRGVLFLTTNRVASFDRAFTSRVHVALHYRRLTAADRARVWAQQFDRLERDSGGKVVVSAGARAYVREDDVGPAADGDRRAAAATAAAGGGGVGEVGRLRWNGREIRNALQTAVALAETEAEEEGLERVDVAERHLRQVVKMSRGFKEFLRKRRGGDEDDDDEDEEGGVSGDDDLADAEFSEHEGERVDMFGGF